MIIVKKILKKWIQMLKQLKLKNGKRVSKMKDNYKGRKNYLTGNVLSDEWYTPLDVVQFIKNNIELGNKKII